jgi:hypothetical protein
MFRDVTPYRSQQRVPDLTFQRVVHRYFGIDQSGEGDRWVADGCAGIELSCTSLDDGLQRCLWSRRKCAPMVMSGLGGVDVVSGGFCRPRCTMVVWDVFGVPVGCIGGVVARIRSPVGRWAAGVRGW